MALVLIIVGAALLLSTIVMGWYTTSVGNGSVRAGETLYPTTVRIWGTQGGETYAGPVLYPNAGLTHTGTVYLAITALLVAGGMVGLSAAYLLRHGAGRPHRRIVPGLLVVAVLLAVAAPTVLVVAQPSALCSDFVAVGTPLLTSPSDNTSGATLPCGWDITTPLDPGPGFGHVSGSTPGPQSTFWGSENGTGEPHSWGPDVGWYVAWVAAAVLLAGALLHLRVGRPGNGTTL
jgi:hypothetical protein